MKKILNLVFPIFFFVLTGCYWQSVNTTFYSLNENEEKIDYGKIEGFYGGDTPVLTLDNDVQIRFSNKDIALDGKDLNFIFTMLSIKPNIFIEVPNVKLIYSKFNIELPVLFNLNFYLREVDHEGTNIIVRIPKLGDTNYYDKKLLPLPLSEVPLYENDRLNWSNKNLIEGEIIIKGGRRDGNYGYFKIVFPFVENGKRTRQVIYFHPVTYQVFVK